MEFAPAKQLDPKALEDLGRATLRIVHDLKNQLNGLKLYATYLRKRLDRDENATTERETVEKLVAGLIMPQKKWRRWFGTRNPRFAPTAEIGPAGNRTFGGSRSCLRVSGPLVAASSPEKTRSSWGIRSACFGRSIQRVNARSAGAPGGGRNSNAQTRAPFKSATADGTRRMDRTRTPSSASRPEFTQRSQNGSSKRTVALSILTTKQSR
jgi:hypothetical protein